METVRKHVGRINGTDRRIVVIFEQIPGNETNALTVDMDSLTDRLKDAVNDVLYSNDGQSSSRLYEVFQRSIVPGYGTDLLNTLHSTGYLRAVPVEQITMYPTIHSTIPLSKIIESHGDDTPSTKIETKSPREQALELIAEAERLERLALDKREEAFEIDPSFKINQRVSANDIISVMRVKNKEVDDMFGIDYKQPKLSTLSKNEYLNVTDDDIEKFLDKAAYRTDRNDPEIWEAVRPRNPTGRPRKDGKPAGSVPKSGMPKGRPRNDGKPAGSVETIRRPNGRPRKHPKPGQQNSK